MSKHGTRRRDYSKRLLSHYLKIALTEGPIKFHGDNAAEIDDILEAVYDEIAELEARVKALEERA